MTSAILFSKPSCFWFEEGKFSGSAQTRNCFTSAPKAHVASSKRAVAIACIRGMTLGQCEHGQHATLVAEVGDVSERAKRSKSGGRILRADFSGDADARPS